MREISPLVVGASLTLGTFFAPRAQSLEEAVELVEAGFEYVTEYEETKIFLEMQINGIDDQLYD